jgi:hypothetical protein
VLHVPGEDAYANVGDRTYRVLAKPPNVITNYVACKGWRLRDVFATGRKGPHNHAQTTRNLRRSLSNTAVGAG